MQLVAHAMHGKIETLLTLLALSTIEKLTFSLALDNRWLVIFDNVELWEDIRSYWPVGQRGVGSIIATTQHSQGFKSIVKRQICLKPLPVVEGAELFLKQLNLESKTDGDPEFQAAKEASDILGGLPLAIAYIAGWLDSSGYELSHFPSLYKKVDQSRHMFKYRLASEGFYDRTLENVWDCSLAPLTPVARSTLNRLSMLSPDRIPESLLFNQNSGTSGTGSIRSNLNSTEHDKKLFLQPELVPPML